MIRLLGILIVLTAIVLTVWGIIENDGLIVIEWIDYYVETSFTFAAIVIFFCLLLFTLLFNVLNFISKLPEELSERFYAKKNKKLLFNLLETFSSIAVFDFDKAKTILKKIPNFSKQLQYPEILTFYKILEIEIIEKSDNELELENTLKSNISNKFLYPIVIRKLIKLKIRQGKYLEAEEFTDDALKLFPKTLEILIDAVTVYKKTAMWAKAAKALKIVEKQFPAYEIKKDYEEIYISNAVKLNEEGSFKEAIEKLENLNKKFPDNVSAVIFLALLYSKVNNKKAALKILEKTWIIFPNVEIATSILQIMESEIVAKKIIALERLISFRSDSYYGYLILAKFLIAENMPQKAQSILQNYLEDHDINSEIALVMAKIETKLIPNNPCSRWLDKVDLNIF